MAHVKPSDNCIEKYRTMPIIWENIETLIEDFNSDSEQFSNVPAHIIDLMFSAFIFGAIVVLNESSSFNRNLKQ